MGRLQDAIAAYDECLDLALRHGLRDEYLAHSANIALVYEDLGDYQSAFGQLRKAASVSRFLLRLWGPVSALPHF